MRMFQPFVVLFFLSAFVQAAPTRPPAPTFTSAPIYQADADGTDFLSCPLQAVTGNNIKYHIVCLSDLTTSLDLAYKAGAKATQGAGVDGPIVSYESESNAVQVPLSSRSKERYFVAAAVSQLNDDSTRTYSGWKVWCDANGVPKSISTSGGSEETFYLRTQFLGSDPTKFVTMATFKSTNVCSLALVNKGTTILNLPNCGEAQNSGSLLVTDNISEAVS